MKIDHEV